MNIIKIVLFIIAAIIASPCSLIKMLYIHPFPPTVTGGKPAP